ncbi:MAG: Hsp20/alpha crystallin family protein, partial [Ruminococcaceae bacterium]|nr:Hsp20/alpha crystallin family protein [Oscillospiraceae bacterium]
ENNSSKDEKDEKGKYICRERYSGSYSRSFYVGDSVTEEDIKAKFENGTLTMDIPKKEALPEKQNKYIAIG